MLIDTVYAALRPYVAKGLAWHNEDERAGHFTRLPRRLES